MKEQLRENWKPGVRNKYIDIAYLFYKKVLVYFSIMQKYEFLSFLKVDITYDIHDHLTT